MQRRLVAQSHPRILVADDEPDLLSLIRTHLEGQGYDVLAVSDGAQALHAARTYRPDLIILDYAMPRMTGYQVLAALHREPDLASLPVIVLTAAAGPSPMEFASAQGAQRYITKPFDLGDLDAAIRAALDAAGGL